MYVIKSVLEVLRLLSRKPQCYADSASTNCFLKFAFVSQICSMTIMFELCFCLVN